MKSRNKLILTGVMTHLNIKKGTPTSHFVLVHNFGGGAEPLFLHCMAPTELLCACHGNGARLLVEGHIRFCGGRIKAMVTKIS